MKITIPPRLLKLKDNPLLPALFMAAVAVLVFATTLIFKRRTFYVFPDNIDQFYAWYQKLTYAVHHGTLPIWDANKNSGHSFVGELQTGVFYPINLLWVLIFGSAKGISIFWLELIVVFHFWLASLGMYYASKSLGLSKYGAIIAGMLYAYGGGVAVRAESQTAIFFGLCYIPWILYAYKTYLDTKQKRYLVLCGIFQAAIILAGHIQPWFHANFMLVIFALFYAPKPSFSPALKTYFVRFKALVLAGILAMIFASPQVLLSAQYLPHAYRFVGDSKPIGPSDKVSFTTYTKTFSFAPQDTLSLVDPVKYPVVDGNELYIGLAALTILVIVMLLYRRELYKHVVWKQNKYFISGTIGITGIIMLGYWTFIPGVLRMLPLFSQIRQLARYSILVHFCIVILAALSIEVFIKKFPEELQSIRKRLLVLIAGGFALLNAIYLYLIADHGLVSKHYVYQSFTVAILLIGVALLRKHMAKVILGVVIISSIIQPVWFVPSINNHPTTYAPNYYRRTSSITYLENYYTNSRVQLLNNALPVNIGDVYNIQTVNGYGATLHKNFFDYLSEPETNQTSGLHMSLLNVRFVVDNVKHPEFALRHYDSDRKVYVYERPQYVPRAYYADQLQPCLARTSDCSDIKVTYYGDNKITLTTDQKTNKKLVLSEVDYAGWKATIDGKKTKITPYSPTNIKLFRSIEVPAGKHTISFKYL